MSRVTVVPFYDRSGLIHETLGTLNTALVEEILVTVIVVRVLVITRRHFDEIPKFAPAILLTVQVFAGSTVLLAVGFILSRMVG